MSIVLVNHYAGDGKNGMEYRPYLMARKWVEMGEEVTIVASSFSHLRSKNPDLGDRPYMEELIDGIRYVWIRGNSYEGNGVARIRNMLSFLFGLYRYRRVVMTSSVRAVIASSTYPLDIYPVRRMAKKYRAKFIFELHDMWPLSPMELGGMSSGHPYIMVMQKAENDWCRTADEVVSLLPAAKSYLVDHGLQPEKFHYIPNGIDVEEWERNQSWQIPELHESVLNSLRAKESFVIGYAGGHGLSNALDTLIDAMPLVTFDNVKVVMVGDGPEKKRLAERVGEMGLDEKVVMLPSVQRQQIPALLSKFDATFFAMKDQPLYRFGVSLNKVMDYMMAGKPIVSALRAGNDYVNDAQCGLSVPPESPEHIAKAFDFLAGMSKEELKEIGMRGREYLLEHNDYNVLANRFLTIIAR